MMLICTHVFHSAKTHTHPPTHEHEQLLEIALVAQSNSLRMNNSNFPMVIKSTQIEVNFHLVYLFSPLSRTAVR